MNFNRRQGLQGLLGVAAGGAIGTTIAAPEAAAQTRAETLRQVMGGIINSLDPTTPGGTRENFGLAMSTYDRLASFGVKAGEGGPTFDMDNIHGELADKIDRSADGLTYTFHIREGATWHDGSPVTTADVKWSLDRMVSARSLAPPQVASGSHTSPDQYSVVGDRQVQVKLPRPDRLALGNLCIPYAMMINSELAKKNASADDPWAMNWLKENTAGGGAYVVETNRPGQQVVLRRNETWKNGKGGALPFFKRIILQTVPEASTRASLVERGDADISIDLAASDVPAILQRGRVKVVSVPQTNAFQAIVFNTQQAPFDNPKVRQALAAALPYEAMFQAAQFGRGRILFGAHWTQVPDAAFPRTMPLNLDLDRAKALLAEAGHPNGFATTFSFANSMAAFAEPMAALIKESLGRIGVEVTVQKMPDSQISTMVVERRLPFFTDIGSAWLPSPDYFFRTYFTGAHRWNYSGFNNPEVNELVQAARFETDSAKYDTAVKRMINIAAEQVPMAMVWQANQDAVMAKNVDGFTYWFHRQVDFRDLKRA